MQKISSFSSAFLEELKHGLAKKEAIVKSFITPEFVKSKTTSSLAQCLKSNLLKTSKVDTLLSNTTRSTTLPVFNHNTSKEKNFSFKASSPLKSYFSSSAKNSNNSLVNSNKVINKPSTPIINKRFDVITVIEEDIKTAIDNKAASDNAFHSYIEKLEKITTEIKKISSTKLAANNKLGEIKTKNNAAAEFSNYNSSRAANYKSFIDNQAIKYDKPTTSGISNFTSTNTTNAATNKMKPEVEGSIYKATNNTNFNFKTKTEPFQNFALNRNKETRSSFNVNTIVDKFKAFNLKTNDGMSKVQSNLKDSTNIANIANNASAAIKSVKPNSFLYNSPFVSFKATVDEDSNKANASNVTTMTSSLKHENTNQQGQQVLKTIEEIAKDIKSNILINNNLTASNQEQHKDALHKEHKQQELFNKLLLELDNKLEVLIQKIIPHFDNLKHGISNIITKENQEKNTLKVWFAEIENKLKELQKTCDLNGLDVDSLHDNLSEINFGEALRLLKNTNLHVHSLIAKQGKSIEEETLLAEAIESLEQKIKDYSKEQATGLLRQIKELAEQQDQASLNNEGDRKKLLSEFKHMVSAIESKPSNGNLQEKLDDLLLKQEDLLKAALNIKSYVVNSNKELIDLKNSNNNKAAEFIEELKTSNKNTTKDQIIFNEKVYNDMELIKKSIIKLVEERQKESANQPSAVSKINKVAENTAAIKPTNSEVKTDKALINTNGNVSINNVVPKQSGKEAEITEADNAKAQQAKENQKASQIKMAIGKLKEALDLESINTIEDLHKEYIDEIIEEKIHHDANSKSANKVDGSTTITNEADKAHAPNSLAINAVTPAANQQAETKTALTNNNANAKTKEQNKLAQNTFILDNSKFFK